MSKRKKKKPKRNYLSEWDSTFLGYDTNFYAPLTSCTPKQVHEIAEQVFGSSYYIDFSSIS